MKKALIVFMAVAIVIAMTSVALAKQENPPADGKGNIVANEYSLSSKDYNEKVQGSAVRLYDGFDSSVHPYGTWNSPYTLGVDGYNYNDAQDYTDNGTLVNKDGTPGDITNASQAVFTSGPHGGYLTSTHRCRECHAVHRAAGKFKLTRGDSRYEACDWCHGTGAGSGFNIQMDNDDNYTTEYNVGHTMGFGIDNGKWKAPDDTYPAYTPNYWIGGFSCFDCHSPHANPARLLGFNDQGQPVGLVDTETAYGTLNKTYSIANPGHDGRTENNYKFYSSNPAEREPVYLAGSWLLIKNADREIAVRDDSDAVGLDGSSGAYVAKPVTTGQEISDSIMAGLHQYDTDTAYPVNKVPIDWNDPIGAAGSAAVGNENKGYDQLGLKNIWNVSEFCTDCHDGNAGLHTVQAPLFSEDRALRGSQSSNGDNTNYKGSYDLAYGHDAQPRH